MIKWIKEDSEITACERAVLCGLKAIGILFSLVQILALVAGSILIFYYFSSVSYDPAMMSPNCEVPASASSRVTSEPKKENGVIYCNYSLFMFGFCLVTMTWICMLVGGLCIGYIFWGQWLRKKHNAGLANKD